MEIKLLHHTPLFVASTAIRKCWASEGKSDSKGYMFRHEGDRCYADAVDECPIDQADYVTCGESDKALIYRVGNKFKHASTLEHITYSFDIDGVSRALLQELARHRIANISVKSTRYTIKELKDDAPFNPCISTQNGRVFDQETIERADKYVIQTGEAFVDDKIIHALEGLRQAVASGLSNDKTKFCLPDAYKTSLVWTINARSLQNFLALRTNKSALWEIRTLAYGIFDNLPEEHKYLFEEFLYKED